VLVLGVKTVTNIAIVCIVLLCGLFLTGHWVDFATTWSTAVFDKDGTVISAAVSEDEQWRLFCDTEVPEKLEQAMLSFEDEYFYWHPGINPVSVVKAVTDNIRAGRIVRGGSTLSMQLARISQGNKARTVPQKIKEMILSLGLEMRYSKKEILQLYGQHAPFGGNIVGYCAASQRYFGKDPEFLSWAEAASIAILPNSPGKIFPGRAQASFIKKRNFLLHKLHKKGLIDPISLSLAMREPLPEGLKYFEQISPHLLQQVKKAGKYNLRSSIDGSLQKMVIHILENFGSMYAANSVNNISALVLDNANGQIMSYVGNVDHDPFRANKDVDMISSMRSPGSTMKPLLYGVCFDEGLITPQSLIEDTPLFINGFSPQNIDKSFRGIVRAYDALNNSLNIPAVLMLREFGIQPFIEKLRQSGFEHTSRSNHHYGLSLILGSNEVTSLESGRAYMNIARKAMAKKSIDISYEKDEKLLPFREIPLSIGSAYQVLNLLKEVKRPEDQDGWEFFESRHYLAWKTGTSYGNRDAWAIGVTRQYTIVVWVGNASGEGRNGLTGLRLAAPVLFAISDVLPQTPWFEEPSAELKPVEVCSRSGFRKGEHCPGSEFILAPKNVRRIPVCDYHQTIVLDASRQFRISSECYDPALGKDSSFFVLSPRVNHYYRIASGTDHSLPPFHPDCENLSQQVTILYPHMHSRILLPREINDQLKPLICKAVSTMKQDTLYWFLNSAFLKTTTKDHAIVIDSLMPGFHQLTVSSVHGMSGNVQFEVIVE
jgi:penicillin-binding protein 1C